VALGVRLGSGDGVVEAVGGSGEGVSVGDGVSVGTAVLVAVKVRLGVGEAVCV
jgi:hypothetical protein